MAKLAMDDPFFFAKALQWYKRRDVEEAILVACESREVSPRYGQGFGKRPDALFYPADVLSFAKRKATSFHCSEERWSDPLKLKTGGSRKELDDLRAGWDLVLDVDCPYWLFAKLTAHLFVRALEDHGIKSVSVKFSGSKGFHVGVPWEAFPELHGDVETRTLFPEAPRAIAKYLVDYIASNLITVTANTIVFDKTHKVSYEKLKEVTGKDSTGLLSEFCKRCKTRHEREERSNLAVFLCGSCGHSRKAEQADYLKCERCNGVMEPQPIVESGRCERCGSTEFESKFNVQALIEVDTILLASRHLFRTPYSLHEKSGLVSVVIPTTSVMTFEKEDAKPEKITSFPRFLDGTKASRAEGAKLLAAAMSQAALAEQKAEGKREFAVPEEAVPEDLFPPCMQEMLTGLTDGKKRALFALTNFFRTCGWGHEQMSARLEEWNKKNPEPLREVILKGHLRYQKTRKEIVPPPNCKRFYQDFGVCHPDQFCGRIKNPAQYAKFKAELLSAEKPIDKPRVTLTDEQKAMRKAYREKKKQEKEPSNP